MSADCRRLRCGRVSRRRWPKRADAARSAESAVAVAVAGTITRDLAVPIVALNRGPRRAWPRVVIEREQPADIAVMAEALVKLVNLGLKVGADEVRARLGFEAPGPDDDVLAPPGARPEAEDAGDAPPRGLDTAAARALVSLARAEARSDDPIDVAADRLAAGWRPLVEPLTEPILRAAAESEGYDALAARLDSAGLWRGTDRDPLAGALHRNTFSARMSGSG